ncbi:acetamidase/formamidase family protein [Actinokineospora sp. HUAS TT18]|uniref:acetamidase/formamidase family protein n=1 Tax=Actinokineospora sp. HUAS TT18 TaxID=3447451 RepID=UPI003F51F3FE
MSSLAQPRHRIAVCRDLPLSQEPHTGHNRMHPDIAPVLSVSPGEVVELEVRDAFDGLLSDTATTADLACLDFGVIHPMTGPVHVVGAEPGDLLEVHVLDVKTEPRGYTACASGFGFLREYIHESFVAHWEIDGCFATSPQIPDVRIPGQPFMGIMAVAPSWSLFEQQKAREDALAAAGVRIFPPDPTSAVPESARDGLRTIPPRENGGNLDIKDLTAGSVVLIPVHVAGALFSVGDGHFAQGDGEVCGAAIETGTTIALRFGLRKGAGLVTGIRYESADQRSDTSPRRYFSTTGIPVTPAGENRAEDVRLATENAVLAMIEYLCVDRGFSQLQAYVLASVAVDIRVSALVDVPNPIVSARIPLDVFR